VTHDDQEHLVNVRPVAEDELLNRRVHEDQVHADGTASSGAFTDPMMSVDRAAMRSIDDSLSEHPHDGIAQFIASAARYLNQEIVPVPSLFNLAHAEVRGKKTRAIAKKLALASVVVRLPHRSMRYDAETRRDDAPPPSS
jgi:hypothetical protein